MALVEVVRTDSIDVWRQKTNLLSQQQGDLDLLLTTDKSSLVAAINESLGTVEEKGRETLIRAICLS